MNLVYLLPFSYFFTTRLRHGSLAFHVIFEWLAAIVVVVAVGSDGVSGSLVTATLSYLAFICLYEIGYIFNDLFAAHHEEGGRLRGPEQASIGWVVAWFTSRLAIFATATLLIDMLSEPKWWSFFAALCLVFSTHNFLKQREYKVVTFLWLAWLRFMAPVIFVVQDSERLGVCLATAMGYSSFRLLGYLDSKGLLIMPGRKRPGFRLFFFLMPLGGALALWPYQGTRGFLVVTLYFALAASVGTAISIMPKKR